MFCIPLTIRYVVWISRTFVVSFVLLRSLALLRFITEHFVRVSLIRPVIRSRSFSLLACFVVVLFDAHLRLPAFMATTPSLNGSAYHVVPYGSIHISVWFVIVRYVSATFVYRFHLPRWPSIHCFDDLPPFCFVPVRCCYIVPNTSLTFAAFHFHFSTHSPTLISIFRSPVLHSDLHLLPAGTRLPLPLPPWALFSWTLRSTTYRFLLRTRHFRASPDFHVVRRYVTFVDSIYVPDVTFVPGIGIHCRRPTLRCYLLPSTILNLFNAFVHLSVLRCISLWRCR